MSQLQNTVINLCTNSISRHTHTQPLGPASLRDTVGDLTGLRRKASLFSSTNATRVPLGSGHTFAMAADKHKEWSFLSLSLSLSQEMGIHIQWIVGLLTY